MEDVYLDSLKTQRFSLCSEEILKLKKKVSGCVTSGSFPGNVFIRQKSELAADASSSQT